MFEDKEFPPNDQSIGSDKWGKVEWKRGAEIFGDKVKLFEGKIEPSDIKQGRLGNCYFLCSLASLAEFPDRIRALILEKEISAEGKYTVRLYSKGMKRKIVIDDYFPVVPGTNDPIFTRGNGSELWVLVLEKAYAKVYGSYAAIESGNVGRAMFELTGYPVRTYKVAEQTIDELWKRLERWDRSAYAMCACVPDDPTEDLQKTVGLIEGHAYSLIGTKNIAFDRCVRLRNPWGNLEWSGEWSDKDPRWTPALRKEMGLPDEDDGSFFMKLEDMVKYFDDISVVYTVEKWEMAHKNLQVTKLMNVIQIELKEGNVFVWMRQPKDYQAAARICVLDEERAPLGGSRDVFLATENLCCDKIKVPKDGKYNVVIEFHPDSEAKFPYDAFVYFRSEKGVKLDKKAADPELAKAPLFILPEFAEKYGTCATCEKPLAAAHMKTGDKKFHKDCFVCAKCGNPLKEYFEIEDKFYCEPCADEIDPQE